MTGYPDPQQARPATKGFIQFNIARTLIALVLLAAGSLALYFVLLPRGGSGASVAPARLVDTPQDGGDGSIGVHPGDLARDFVASDLEGVPATLSSLRGRPVVVNFWATWCTSCLAEMPELERQRIERRDDGLTIVAVNVGERESDAREFIESLGLLEFVVAMDPDLTVADAYGVRGLPHSVFIDRDGVIQAEYRGQLGDETMERYVLAAIDAVPGGDPPERIRLVTTVPREHVLDVYVDEDGAPELLLVSRRFRCDDDYCAEALLPAIEALPGVSSVSLTSQGEEPALRLAYEMGAATLEEVVGGVANALRGYEDPLYTRDLEVRYAD